MDSVSFQDEWDGAIGQLNVGDEVKYGYRLLAGEPCPSDTTRWVFFLQIAAEDTGKIALTYRYLNHGETVLDFVRVRMDEEPPTNPDSDNPPVTYPDPESDLPDYDEPNDE